MANQTHYTIDDVMKELIELKSEVSEIKKSLKEEDLSEFVNFLKEKNLLASDEDAKNAGLRL